MDSSTNLFEYSIYIKSNKFLDINILHKEQQSIQLNIDPLCYQINDIIFDNLWKTQLQQKLNQVQILQFHQVRLSAQNLQRIFTHNLPKIKRIQLTDNYQDAIRNSRETHQALTPQHVQTIFTSSYFPQLQTLDLSSTYIQFRHFSFLQQMNRTIESNLKVLNLKQNYLQKRAFQLLSKIDFNGKLQSMSLAQNSLIDGESIDSIIKIIQPSSGYSLDGSSRAIMTNVTVFSTSITTDNLIKLLDHIDVSKLQSLNIGQNSYQHSISFDIPFNNTLFQYLSKLNYTSLKRLSFADMDIDQQQLQYLKFIKAPQLETLILIGNFITDNYFLDWITKQNMPLLKRIDLISNDITDKGIEYLVNQGFQHLDTIELSQNRRLTSKHLDHLSRMNSSKLKYLVISQNSINQDSLRRFFQNKSFENLEYIHMTRLKDAAHLFEYINWQSMTKLKRLYLDQTDVSLSFPLIFSQNITFPSLKVISIGGQWINSQHMSDFIHYLNKFGPQLELVQLNQNAGDSNTYHLNVSEIKPQTIPDGCYVKSQLTIIRKPINSSKLQLIQVSMDSSFFFINFDYTFFEVYDQTDVQYFMQFWSSMQLIKLVSDKLQQMLILTNIQNLQMYIAPQLLILTNLFFPLNQKVYQQEYDNFMERDINYHPTTTLPYLHTISYIPYPSQWPSMLYYLTKINMPNLNALTINTEHKIFPKLANKLIKQSPTLKNLIIIKASVNCQSLETIFHEVQLPYLQNLNLESNQIQTSCLKQVLEKHSFVKVLYLDGNFLQTGIFQTIKKLDLLLQFLAVSDIQIGNQQFAKLALINRQFMNTLSLRTININSEGIKMLVGNSTTTRLFPKLNTIDLQSNFITQDGVNALLSTGMPFLSTFIIFQVSNPNLLNSLFSHPNHLFQIAIDQNTNIYGLNQNLDTRAVRRIKLFLMQAPNLILQDYKIMSRLNFLNLLRIDLVIQNIYQCEILQYILKIVQNVQFFMLHISNQKTKTKTLNDACLVEHNVKQRYMKHISAYAILWAQQNAYIPKFYSYLFSDQQILDLVALSRCLIGDQNFFKIIRNCNTEYMVDVELDYCLLTDRSVVEFFQLPLQNIQQIDLSRNQFSAQALRSLVDRTFQSLISFQLSQNNIGDKAMVYLTQVNFPQLQALALNNIGMTREGLLKLKQLNTPKLTALSIYNNQFTEEDLMQFFEDFPFDRFPYLLYISLKIRIKDKNYQRILTKISKKWNRPIQLDGQYYRLELNNKAKIKIKQN